MSDEADYVGFYTAFQVQFIAMLGNAIGTSVSVYVGMFFYSNGMTEDIKANVAGFGEIESEKSPK